MIEGSLRNVPLADVFQVVATSQKSGTLTLDRGRGRAWLRFEAGRVLSGGLLPGVDLAEVLVRMEILSARQALGLLAGGSGDDGGVELARRALQEGLIDRELLDAALERQLIEVLAELLTWNSGSFSFGEEVEPGLDVAGHDAMMLLMRVTDQLAGLGAEDENRHAVYRKIGDPTKVTVPDHSWEVLGALDGRRSAAAVAAEVDLPERQVYLILAALERAGVVETTPYAVEVPVVLVVTSSNAQGRLLRLLLLRSRTRPRLEEQRERVIERLNRDRPRALVIDDRDGEGWELLREVRRQPGMTHLPAVVLGDDGTGGVLARLRRPRGLSLRKPFDELEFEGLINRMVGVTVG